MKKTLLVLSTVLALVALMLCLTVSVSAEETTTDVIYSGTWGTLSWTFNETTGELVISGEGKMNDFTSSSTDAWRAYKTSIKTVTIKDGVTSIGNYAFYSCVSLTSITIPGSVTSIGDEVFCACGYLTSVTIPEGVTSIGDRTFSYCGLENIIISDSVTNIGDQAFVGCYKFTSIKVDKGNKVYHSEGNCLIQTASKTLIAGCFASVIPADGSVTSLGENAFSGCICYSVDVGCRDITIPDCITSIGDDAFLSCTGLTNVNFAENSKLTQIGNYAFYSCQNLYNINIPNRVTSIGEYAFAECSRLGNITIPDSVTDIGDKAFRNCEFLIDVILSNSLTGIGEETFAYCIGLTRISIPDSVTSIGKGAFAHCDNLTEVTGGNGLLSIGQSAFAECGLLELVTIPNGVKSIGRTVFISCYRLSTITIPKSVTDIGMGAFNKCTDLSYIIYLGTEEEWNANVTKGTNWDYNAGSNVEGYKLIFLNNGFKIKNAYLELSDDIDVLYTALVPEICENPYMVFEFMGKEYTAIGTLNENGSYTFRLETVLPQYMGENIKATLYASINGYEFYSCVSKYSVRQYCVNQLAKSSDEKLITLLSDLLSYGAAAQLYVGYNTDSLVTDGLTLTPGQFTELDVSVSKKALSGEADGENAWKCAGLVYENAMSMYLKFSAEDPANLEVQVTVENRTETYTVADMEIGEDGYYTLYFHNIHANEFDSEIKAIFVKNGEQTGQTMTYSVNSYVVSKQNNEDELLAGLVRATYNYGASAAAYADSNQ
ncbi:MAG: leucine-rich repeat protein [Clostridia bacterium]|nr:leucine-rich repeat protein [Clostridia bacterium]